MADACRTDKTLDLLTIFRNLGGNSSADGLRVVTIQTADPYEVTLVMAGTNAALDLDIFEVPIDFYPLRVGDQFLAYPIVAASSGRWGLITKLNGGLVMATMKSVTTCQPDGSEATYNVTAPAFFAVSNVSSNGSLQTAAIAPLKAGDRVSIGPTWDGKQIKYVVLNRY
ncbi:hypothetical protein [Paenibacillus sp. BK720]|uniref:hypothetical protein n=1 Tax=Paenibacillus sp. BK720 TaxID=2587092 RepID=UPI001420B3D6|nr:hypothetical protein [Paenibacillus sp. BK720]NIK67941.1 hypothetical protein [Paenibacillus sp. BK720]